MCIEQRKHNPGPRGPAAVGEGGCLTRGRQPGPSTAILLHPHGCSCTTGVAPHPGHTGLLPTDLFALDKLRQLVLLHAPCVVLTSAQRAVARGWGGQTSREGGKVMWWTARTARGGTGHLGLTETQRGRLWTACGQRCVDSKNSQTTPATTSTSSIRQLLGAADTQTAHPATFSTALAHQRLGSANAETTPAGAPAAAADRTQRPDATCEGKNG